MIKWKEAIKNRLAFSLYYSGLNELIWRRGKDKAIILMYHSFQNRGFFPQEVGLTIPVEMFSDHIKYLRKSHNIISLKELVECKNRKRIPPRAIVLTLDDGYRDNYTHAYPVLMHHRVPATIFLTTDYIGTNNWIPLNKFYFYFLRSQSRSLKIVLPDRLCSSYNAELLTFNLSSYFLKGKALLAIRSFLKYKILEEEREKVIADLLEQLDPNQNIPLDDNFRFLSWSEVREMKMAGIDFGAHTKKHHRLTKISVTDALREITESREIIAKNIGEKVDLFAYPNGSSDDFNLEIQNILRANGFICACTTLPGTVKTADNVYALNRFSSTVSVHRLDFEIRKLSKDVT